MPIAAASCSSKSNSALQQTSQGSCTSTDMHDTPSGSSSNQRVCIMHAKWCRVLKCQTTWYGNTNRCSKLKKHTGEDIAGSKPQIPAATDKYEESTCSSCLTPWGCGGLSRSCMEALRAYMSFKRCMARLLSAPEAVGDPGQFAPACHISRSAHPHSDVSSHVNG